MFELLLQNMVDRVKVVLLLPHLIANDITHYQKSASYGSDLYSR